MSADFGRLLEEYALKDHKVMPQATLAADAPATPAELTVDNVRGLSLLEPFGAENEKPLFYIGEAELLEVLPLSDGLHSKLRLKAGFAKIDALMFRTAPTALPVKVGDRCDMIVTLGVNSYRGRDSVSVVVSDIRPHTFEQSKYFAALGSFEAFMRGEELPKNYYPSMYPSREEAVKVYKAIPENGINLDRLYISLTGKSINYCKFRFAIEAFRELGLVKMNASDFGVSRVKVSTKTDLYSAPVLEKLRSRL